MAITTMKGAKEAATRPTEESAGEIAKAVAEQVAAFATLIRTFFLGTTLDKLLGDADGEELGTATTSRTLIVIICAMAGRAPVSRRRLSGWLYVALLAVAVAQARGAPLGAMAGPADPEASCCTLLGMQVAKTAELHAI